MNTQEKRFPQKAAEQIDNHLTGWIGQVPGRAEHIVKGQTFIANSEGDLQAIQVFSNVVMGVSQVHVTIHLFDPLNHTWGHALGSSSLEVKQTDAGKWISFDLPGPHLNKGQAYGFRLNSIDSYIGIGEAGGSFRQPQFKDGEEWQFTNSNPEGDFFSYFSLAFKIELAA